MSKGNKILFVEDDRILNEAISHKLTKEGFDVVLAYNGEEGLIKARSEKPDLILLDILLPKMNGLDMLAKLRETDADTPVILLTNVDSKKSVAEGLEQSVSGYLVKSNYSLEEIISLITKTLKV